MDLAEFMEKYFGPDTACGDAGPGFSDRENDYLATYGPEAVAKAFEEAQKRLKRGLVVFPIGEEDLPWSAGGAGASVGVLMKMIWNMPPMLAAIVPTSDGIKITFEPKER